MDLPENEVVAVVGHTVHSTQDEIEEIQNALHANPAIGDAEMRTDGTLAIYRREADEE